ncbi:MAG TPA: hypothetical protein VG944_18665 [Fimbriimonas sp.]|nr:hypothetical protein [Fimbriimonas sp.]
MTDVVNLAVLGAGSVRCMPPVIASLATYFGERPLDIRFWDADDERLDLFDRFARYCFNMNHCGHRLTSSDDWAEALAGATHVVLAIGPNCARKYLEKNGSLLGHGETSHVLVQRAATELIEESGVDASVLSLIDVQPAGRAWKSVDWPGEMSEAEQTAMPHQILRFLNGDEYPHDWFRQESASPLKAWLDAGEGL